MATEYNDKLLAFACKVETQSQARLRDQDLGCETNIINAKTHIRSGKKYDKVDIGRSGRFMVVVATGEIFGIKSYGTIHRGHAFGTLDTIEDWYWGDYTPMQITVT